MRLLELIAKHFVGLAIVSYAFGIARSAAMAIKQRSPEDFLPWRVTQYYINYLDFGFVKRGLVGTIFHPLFSRLGGNDVSTRLVIVGIDLMLFAVLLWLLKRALDRIFAPGDDLATLIKAALVISPVGFMQFSLEAGRFDHINFLLIAISVVLLLRRRTVWASACVAAGILVHEAVFVFGFPILFAICVQYESSQGRQKYLRALKFSALPIVMAAVVAFFGNSSVDPRTILPPELAAGAEVWSRGLLEPKRDLRLGQAVIIAIYALLSYLILWRFYVANGLRVDLVFLATLCPLALFALGIDYARWTGLIAVTVLTAILYHATQGQTKFLSGSGRVSRALLGIYLVPLGPMGTVVALPYVASFFRNIS
jgi:hypothetical protein